MSGPEERGYEVSPRSYIHEKPSVLKLNSVFFNISKTNFGFSFLDFKAQNPQNSCQEKLEKGSTMMVNFVSPARSPKAGAMVTKNCT